MIDIPTVLTVGMSIAVMRMRSSRINIRRRSAS